MERQERGREGVTLMSAGIDIGEIVGKRGDLRVTSRGKKRDDNLDVQFSAGDRLFPRHSDSPNSKPTRARTCKDHVGKAVGWREIYRLLPRINPTFLEVACLSSPYSADRNECPPYSLTNIDVSYLSAVSRSVVESSL